MASVILTLGAAVSWGQVPTTNDTSDISGNTGGGTNALHNATGVSNTAYGHFALQNQTSGSANTALGVAALLRNTIGDNNTALGYDALFSNTTGNNNTAGGFFALTNNISGAFNTALGVGALTNSAGNSNLALGYHAGYNLTSGDNNIYLGSTGTATESKTLRLGQGQTRTFIAGITGTLLGSGVMVLINPNTGRLGTVVSSARYKRDITEMGERSQRLFKLRPVTFRYKQDAQGVQQYGLIAEEVAKVYPELVTKGADGKVESVQYHELIPMLLNEVQHQQQQITELKTQNESLRAALVQQNAALAARLEKLEAEAARTATLATR